MKSLNTGFRASSNGCERALIATGDSLAILKKMPSASVHCCVTSPPYWGLRDYGTAKWKGGRRDCDHKKQFTPRSARPACSFGGARQGSNDQNASREPIFKDRCGKCGAIRIDAQLGLERTPEEYVSRMVELFREVRRVLRDDGTLWLNLGDSYAAGKTGRADHGSGDPTSTLGPKHDGLPGGTFQGATQRTAPPGLKPKDLVGIPWRVAFALQADGWYLRSDIIWHKPNPMPESVTDRPTKAHEYLFLLAKSQKYFYDADAIKEPCSDAEYRTRGKVRPSMDSLCASDEMGGDNRSGLHLQVGGRSHRNRRTVWTVTTRPFKGAHFATFPPKLIEPCILAGCPFGGVVLDPFVGAGTTLLVAQQHGRNSLGIELNPEYVKMARARLGLRTERTGQPSAGRKVLKAAA